MTNGPPFEKVGMHGFSVEWQGGVGALRAVVKGCSWNRTEQTEVNLAYIVYEMSTVKGKAGVAIEPYNFKFMVILNALHLNALYG